jgi:hypothetical protein
MNNPFTAFFTDPGSSIYLRLDLKNTGVISEDISNPFVAVDVSRPFTSVMKANVVTSSGSVVKEVFLVIARDEYLQYGNLLEDITNKTLDESWQRIIKSSLKDKNGMLLSDRTDPAGAYLPFDPFFYCVKSGIYFTPVCPACSSGFDVCRDETLLRENDLASYLQSLKRYLYCPECHAQGRVSVFYSASKSLDDPKDVKDRQALIQGFVNLLVKADSKIPCSSCEHRTGCYGEDWPALNNIVSLSFYPFYAVLSEAGTINASDFLQLLSGASYWDIENSLKARGLSGRLNAVTSFKNSKQTSPILLFEADDRVFLEILYLKLSFAADFLSRIVRGSGGLEYPDLGLGPESIWVALPDSGGYLPAFWNFRSVYLKGPETEESFHVLPGAPKCYFAYFFGRFLIYTLLSNPLVSRNEINACLKEALNAFINGEPLDPELLVRGVFRPENIFYKPEGHSIRKEFSDIFKEALGIGVSLMLHGYAGDGGFPEEEFISSLSTIKEEIRKMLFTEGHIPLAVSTAAGISRPEDELNAGIIGILDNISKKWLDSEKTAPLIIKEPALEESFEKTIVVPAQKARQEVNIIEEPEDFHETIILNAATLSGKARKTKQTPEQRPEPPGSQEDLLEATIMMSQNTEMASKTLINSTKADEGKTQKTENKGDELSETVIIKKKDT